MFDETGREVRRLQELVVESAAAIQHLGVELRRDPLSGVLNRRGIHERLKMELSRCRRTESELAVLVVDIVGLKALNDKRGHAAGDALIRGTAVAINAHLRATDHCGRTGGDEFLVLLPGTDLMQAAAVSDRILTAVHRVHMNGVNGIHADVVIGSAATSEEGVEAPALVKRADSRLIALRGKDVRSRTSARVRRA
ncbi:MAG: GGDEF domain-containing protein [Candidatus Dormibacteria bacterium]